MKAFVVATVARQVEGEYVFIRLEKGYTQASKADGHVRSLVRNFTENMQVPGAGQVPCLCERGVLEVDIEMETNEQKS